jgi:hypothetical protein
LDPGRHVGDLVESPVQPLAEASDRVRFLD